MPVRVSLVKGADAAAALKSCAGRPTANTLWVPDQPSPYGAAAPPIFDAVLAQAVDAAKSRGASTHDYEAEEVVAKPGPQVGIGLLALLTPLTGMPLPEVHRHWDEHIALANVIHHKATSYRQFRFRRALSPDAPNYAGFAILHFPSADDLRTGLYRNESDVETIRADVAEFALGADTMFVTEYRSA